MMQRDDVYVAVAIEMDKIMKDNFGDKYNDDILNSYCLTCSDGKKFDELVASYGIKISSDGYDIKNDDVHKIALGELNKQVNEKAPCELETNRLRARIDHEVAKVQDAISQYSFERLPELYNDIIEKLDNIHDIYFANKDKLSISEDKYHDVLNRIEDIKEQVEELSTDVELNVYAQEDKENGLLQQLKSVSPRFEQEQSEDDRDLDEM